MDLGQTKTSCFGCGLLHGCSGRSVGSMNRADQAELLAKAHIPLDAFMIGLEPLGPDHASSSPPRTDLGQVVGFHPSLLCLWSPRRNQTASDS